MFNDINEVLLMGRITQDPTNRSTSTGAMVLSFSLATNRSYKKNEQWEKEVTFHNVVIFGPYAERLSSRIQKGTKVYVKGRLVNNKWTDNEGNPKSRTDINANEVILLDNYVKTESEGSFGGGQSQQFNQSEEIPMDKPSDEDLPF